MILMSVALFILGTLSAGGAYLAGVGVKPQEAQRHFKKSTSSSVSKERSSTEVQEVAPSTSSEANLVNDQPNQVTSTTAQENIATNNTTYDNRYEPTFEATYAGVTAFSTLSYSEALAIAKSLALNQD